IRKEATNTRDRVSPAPGQLLAIAPAPLEPSSSAWWQTLRLQSGRTYYDLIENSRQNQDCGDKERRLPSLERFRGCPLGPPYPCEGGSRTSWHDLPKFPVYELAVERFN